MATTTTMTTMTMNTTTGTILLPPTPPQTPPLEAKKPTISTFHSPLPASYNTIDFEKPPQPQPPKPSSLTLLSPALPIPVSPSTTFAFEKAPPASQPSPSLLAASARLSALGWKSRSRQGPQGDCRLLQKPNRSLAVPTLLPGGVPSVVVHGPKCECREREQKTEKAGDDELVARVLALSQRSMVQERVGQQQQQQRRRRMMMEEREREQRNREESSAERRTWRKKGVFGGWKVEIPKELVSRFFHVGGSGSTTSLLSDSGSDSDEPSGAVHVTDKHKITDLCLACSNLDVDKIIAQLFTNTNMVPTSTINGRCTITSMSGSEVDSAQPQVETTPLFSVLRSPLFATRPKSQMAILGLLLDLGADPNSSVSIPPLSFESTVHLLSGQSQSQSQPVGRITLLSAACVLGLPDAVSLLLERGARVDARETNLPLGVDGRWGKGLSALDVAIMAGPGQEHEAIVEGLLRSGANVTGSCELFLPAQAPPSKLAGTIGGSRPKPRRLRSASTVNFISTSSRQQGQQQQQHQHQPYQRQGAQVPQWPSLGKTWTTLSGVTPLHLAALSGHGHLGIASMILSSPFSKADTNARTSSSSLNGGRTPLHYAAETLNLEVSSLLLSDPRTDPDATDDDGATPLALLVGRLEKLGNGGRRAEEEVVVELVRRLLRAGANAGVRCNGTDLSLKARLLAMDDDQDMKWGTLFEEDGRGVLRGSMKRRTF
ncbi:ankyrin repeat-containing domain protein [Pseudoneurospora amorphoporcata]|uniref:Ankyrin repeat-containing domain protein n=1 Tax=Pseudoneurospora amorphoporcata TaxID=241081 RepID=A0AAN6NN10_9PEZI|nr:ankyrin repeat-containing domain protein [Pseudoneurospora amorphoporcata]